MSGAAAPDQTISGATRARSAPRQIAGIQILRALAALSVAFLHIEQSAGVFVGRVGESPWPWLRAIPWEAGVDMFFVISGFVMVYASDRLFRADGASRDFLSRRITRVVPLYWLFTTLTVLVAVVRPGLLNEPLGSGWDAVVASYLFIPWARPDGFVQPVFRLGWTLNYEMLFYVIFTPFVMLTRRWAVLGVVAAIGALVVVGQLTWTGNTQIGFWTDPIVSEFAFGVLLGALRLEGLQLSWPVRLGLIAAGLCIMLAVGVDDTQTRALSYGIPATCFVAAVSFGSGRAGTSLIARGALLLGDASYALYLVHLFPTRLLREIWFRLHLTGTAGIVSFIAVSMAASCVVAVGVHVWVERPLVRSARRLLRA
ncbi:MAG: acyltransferase [Alphaproteobacteria bacterium]|nr:acyltransferase [Alphaproteobacteria bacterium]